MNMYTNTKKSKKFILILVLFILFNFVYPQNVKAGLVDDIVAAPAKIFWAVESGVLEYLNNIFAAKRYVATSSTSTGTSSPGVITQINVYLTPENIIKGAFLLFDANIFRDITGDNKYFDVEADGTGDVVDAKIKLRETIAGWYYSLRNFAIVALLSVLVYVGIRMVISTVAQDKAKYKIMFKDWLVALCLLVLMHYIMIGILEITSIVVNAMGGGENADMIRDLSGKITGILSSTNGEYTTPDGENLGDAYAYIMVMAGIIVYTFIFAIKYLKREFTIIFLILLGPVSCITYPIDKISDGKAQAFNKWFSEFLYQVIIQPFHLLLYIVLIGTAADMASTNVIYALICFAVMGPAEKFVKEMFGFKDSLGSPLAAAAAGGAIGNLLSKGANSLMKSKGSGGSGGKDKGGDNNSSDGNGLPPKTVDKPGLVDGNAGEGENGGAGLSLPEGDGDGMGDTAANLAAAHTINENIENASDDSPSAAEQMDDAQGQQEEIRQVGDKIDDAVEDAGENAEEIKEKDKNEGDDKETLTSDQEEGTKQIGDGSENGESGNNAVKERWYNRAARKAKEGWDNIKVTHSKRNYKKYGTNSRWKRNGIRLGRGVKALAKGTARGVGNALKRGVKVAGVAALATTGATIAALSGNGKEALGMLTGAAGYAGSQALGLGKDIATDAIKGGKKAIKNVAKGSLTDYKNALRKDEGTGFKERGLLKSKEELAFKAFKSDPKEFDKAVQSYKENHEGREPSGKDIETEMQDRFALSRYGLDDAQIDRAVGSYQKLRDVNKVPDKDALNQTVYAAKLANDYSKKDFRSKKTMDEAVATIADKFQSYGVKNRGAAEQKARKYLQQAAEIKGTEAALSLPSTHTTIDVPVKQNVPNMFSSLGLDNSQLNTQQIERINNVTLRLHREGFNSGELETIAASCTGGTVTEVLDKYEAKVEYLDNGDVQAQATKQIEARNNGNKATEEQVKAEMKERLIVKSTMGVSKETTVSKMRQLEETHGTTEFREVGRKAIKGELSKADRDNMTDNQKDMMRKYKSLATAEANKDKNASRK